MDYRKHYDLLIKSRQNLLRQEYTETHHILPKCYGGTDSPDNLIELTAREHFIAHWLLWRANRDRKSAAMFNAMCRISKGQNRYTNSRGYQEAREAVGSVRRGVTLSEEHRLKIKENNARTGKPNWNSGKKWQKQKVQCSKCGEWTSSDCNRKWHESNCQLEEYTNLLKLYSRKDICMMKNISNEVLQYWVNKIKKRHGITHSA